MRPLGTEPFDVAAGDVLTVSVVIQNKGIGHSLVPEQRDFYECWVEFQAKDAAGDTLMDSGAVGPNGTLDPTAHSFTNRLVNVRGTLNDLHQVWDTRIVAYNNTIQSGRSQIVRYQFKVPENAIGANHDYRQGQLPALQPALYRLRTRQALRTAGGRDDLAHADAGIGHESRDAPRSRGQFGVDAMEQLRHRIAGCATVRGECTGL